MEPVVIDIGRGIELSAVEDVSGWRPVKLTATYEAAGIRRRFRVRLPGHLVGESFPSRSALEDEVLRWLDLRPMTGGDVTVEESLDGVWQVSMSREIDGWVVEVVRRCVGGQVLASRPRPIGDTPFASTELAMEAVRRALHAPLAAADD
jgi:hypothetical protein